MTRLFSSAVAFVLCPAAALLGAPAALAAPALPTDTVVVRLPNQAVLTLVVRDAAQLRELKKYQLDSLTSRLAGYITQAEAAAQTSATDRVTMKFYPDKDRPGQNLPAQISVTARKPSASAPAGSSKLEVLLNKKFGVTNAKDGDGENGKSFSFNVGKSKAERQAGRDSTRQARVEEQNGKTFLVLDLGRNVFVNRPAESALNPDTRPIELRQRLVAGDYVNIGLNYRCRLGGKHSPLRLTVGPEFAFNNYMLSGNDKWVNVNSHTFVVRETDPTRQYEKSKLATSSVNLPLMLQVRLRDKHYKPTFTFGAGGFVGYRLLTWSKLKYTLDGETKKDKDYNPYNMQDLQYGLQGTLGFGSLTLFAKYNLSKLFKAGQGPDTQVLSFGIRLLGQ